ncbi:MAG TPA: haloperoxidase, partial [Chloroflexota bacterium]|nr:haloperoxidase [Chloroflexota bacterium]
MRGARYTRRSAGRLMTGLSAGAALLRPLGTAVDAFAEGEETGPFTPNAVLRWNQVALDTIRRTRPAPPVASRALAILHTAIYDAWAAYDATAVGTRLGGALRRPAWEQTAENKQEALSFAAFRALTDLWPAAEGSFAALLRSLGYDPAAALPAMAGGGTSPAAVGTLAALAALDFRHKDGSNQLGERGGGAYGDYTGYTPVNGPDAVSDPNHWQPLKVADGQGVVTVQKCVVPQWGRVTPFGMSSGTQLRPESPPPLYPSAEYAARAEQLLELSATLGDSRKVIAEYWEGGPGTTTPPGHWHEFAQWVSRRDGHDLDRDAKLFFVLGNALMDAAIASWDCKQAIDYVRPITAIRFLFKGKSVRAWAGPFKGSGMVDGAEWQPYQRTTFVTPPFPEF